MDYWFVKMDPVWQLIVDSSEQLKDELKDAQEEAKKR